MTAKKHLLFGFYITAIVGLNAYVFGTNDKVSLLLLAVSLFLLYPVILVGQMTIRNAAKTNFTPESGIYQWLNKPKTLWQQIFSLILAAILSISFLIVAKGIVIEHGLIASLLIVFLVTSAASALITSTKAKDAQDRTVSHEVTRHHPADLSFLGLFLAVFFVNLALALVLSAAETHKFLGSDVGFLNFVQYASDRSIPKLDTNEFSRILINVYVIMDAFKLAVVNELLSAFHVDKQNYFVFYPLLFVLNLLKLFAFSLPLVFAQRSLMAISEGFVERRVVSIWGWTERGIVRAVRGARSWGSRWARMLRGLLNSWRKK